MTIDIRSLPLWQPNRECTSCGLRAKCAGPVPGIGPLNASIMFIGEAPGQREDEIGFPFRGAAGREFDRQLTRIGLNRDNVWVDNLCKCRPAGSGRSRDFAPTTAQASFCANMWLDSAIRMIHPRLIVTMGVPATTWINNNIQSTMEDTHGRVQRNHRYIDLGIAVISIYHPASVLRDRGKLVLKLVDRDFDQVKAIVDGTYEEVYDRWTGREHYQRITPNDWLSVMDMLAQPLSGVIAVDTEAKADGKSPLSVQLSTREGEGFVLDAVDIATNQEMVTKLSTSKLIMHNAAYDLPMLWQLGIYPSPINIGDTMIMAWMLQDLPLGLKPLARQLCGMEMKDYPEMIAAAQNEEVIKAAMSKQSSLDPSSKLHKRLSRLIVDIGSGAKAVARWNEINSDSHGMIGPAPSVDLSHPLIDPSDAIWYSGRDPDATLRVYNILRPRIDDMGMTNIYRTDMAALPLVARMMYHGMPVNRHAVFGLQAIFDHRMADVAKQCHELAGHPFNVGSDDQVAKVVFGEIKSVITGNQLVAREVTPVKHRPKVDTEALEPVKAHHPIIPAILQYKHYDTMQDSYVGPMLAKMVTGGHGMWRIHGRINPAGTETGRYKHSDPNTAATPVRYEEGRWVRSTIEAPPGKLLVAWDWSQLEMRVMSVDSGDAAMMQLFRDGRDIHAETAAKIWGVPLHVIQDEHRINPYGRRYIAKRGGFGTIYWISARGFKGYLEEEATALGEGAFDDWDEKRCQQFLDDYFKLYPKVREYGMERQAEARRYGYVRDMWGRIRLLPQIRSTNNRIRSEGEREAVNSPIQSGAMGLVKSAMGKMEETLPSPTEEFIANTWPILQVHDEVISEVDEAMVDWVATNYVPLLQSATPDGKPFPVPIIVEVKVGKRWGDMKAYKPLNH